MGMTTRHLAVRFDENGAMRTVKTSRSINPEKLKIRATYGIKILDCLKKGRSELLAQKNPPMLHSNDPFGKDYLDTIELEILSTKICDLCYDRYDRQQFKRKIFDIYTNLKRDNNKDLRRRVLTKEMSVEELVRADTLELAPDVLKRKREEEVEAHYRRNVILPTMDQDPVDQVIAVATVEDIPEVPVEPTMEPEPSTPPEDKSARLEDTGSEEGSSSDSYDDEDSESEPETEINESGNESEPVESQPEEVEESIELTSKATAARRIDSDDEQEEKLAKPPSCLAFTVEETRRKIEERIKKLPKFIAKAFMSPFQAGSKRIDSYVKRSTILSERQSVVG